MKVTVKTKYNKTPEIISNAKAVSSKHIIIANTGEHAWLSHIHEYGCTIPVTDKMRKWFAAQGVYLKKTKTVIRIPERSHMRSGWDSIRGNVINQGEKMLALTLSGNMSVDNFLNNFGKIAATNLRTYARNLRTPANAPLTVEWKGSSNPLVDSGKMINGINYVIE